MSRPNTSADVTPGGCTCDTCGEHMYGEWMDGSELRCDGCGNYVVAVSYSDGSWGFPLLEEAGDE